MNDTSIITLSRSKYLRLESILQKYTQSYMSRDVSRVSDCDSKELETTSTFRGAELMKC